MVLKSVLFSLAVVHEGFRAILALNEFLLEMRPDDVVAEVGYALVRHFASFARVFLILIRYSYVFVDAGATYKERRSLDTCNFV